jgi:hypothetical protein
MLAVTRWFSPSQLLVGWSRLAERLTQGSGLRYRR